MDSSLLERSDSLQTQVRRILKERMTNGFYPPNTRLPAESELAAEFNISRATVRSALSALENEGLIVRRWGVGTFVSQLALISNPISEAIDFNELIFSSGFTPGVNLRKTSIVKADLDIAKPLGVSPETKLLVTEKVFTADGDPVIYCINYIPSWIMINNVMRQAVAQPEITEPIYSFLEKFCQQKTEYHIAQLWADLVQDSLISIPDFDPLTPMLVMKSVAYNAEARPIFLSLSAYPDKRMQFTLIRRQNVET